MRLENTFLAADGVTRTTEQQLWSAGITHWTDYTPTAHTDLLEPDLTPYIEEASSRLAAGDATYFAERLPAKSQWRLYENFRDDACFLDIETTGLDRTQDLVTTVSVHCGGNTTTFVRDRTLSRERLKAILETAPLLITYNGRRFDIPFLEAAFDLDITTPHLDAMDPCHHLDIYGGLSGAEAAFGIDRSHPDVDGAEAVRLWHSAERGSDEALERLIEYNQEDTVNLKHVLDAVTDRLHQNIFCD